MRSMKSYFNKRDREHLLIILTVWDCLKTWVEECTCLSKTEKKYLRAAISFLLKVSDSIVERMDIDFAKKIVKDAKNSGLLMVDKRSNVVKRDIKVMTVDVDSIYDLSSYALKECWDCKEKEAFKNCDRYRLFLSLDVPPVCIKTDSCPYFQN